MNKEKTIEKAFDQTSGKIKSKQQIMTGLKTIRKYISQPSKALRAGAMFLEPLLSQRYDRWNLRRKDFDLLVKLSQRYRSLARFIETYTLDPISTTTAARSKNQDAVSLITVHSAKGTESRVCYVIRVQPGIYPYIRSIGNQDEEEEERRILYVAMTRTKDELILTRSQSRGSYGISYRGAAAAYFLSTVPDNLVEKHWQYGVLDDY